MTRSAEPVRRASSGQAGVATVWALAWMFVCLTVGWVAVVLAVAVAGQHHVDGSADLVALSATARLQRGGDACSAAAEVAAANRVRLLECRVLDRDVVVTVSAYVDLPFGLRRAVSGQARAGPP